MSLLSYKNLLFPAIESYLQKVVDQFLPSYETELRKMIVYHLGWEGGTNGPDTQGKRIRPLLLLLTTISLDSAWQSALPAAASIELIHNFSLIHDDIQDKSELRRNRPTIWTKWGIPQAINTGDTMFTLAQLAMLKMAEEKSPLIALRANQLLNQACISLTNGQYLDLLYETRSELTLDDYWPMIEGKTAALLAACTEVGALLSSTTAERISALRNFGFYLGMAFQVQDDLLGIWGEESETGKSTDSDLVSGKKTLPVLYALGKHGRFHDRWVKGPITAMEVEQVVDILSNEGAYDYTKAKANQMTRLALEALDAALPVKNEGGQSLLELTDELLHRKS